MQHACDPDISFFMTSRDTPSIYERCQSWRGRVDCEIAMKQTAQRIGSIRDCSFTPSITRKAHLVARPFQERLEDSSARRRISLRRLFSQKLEREQDMECTFTPDRHATKKFLAAQNLKRRRPVVVTGDSRIPQINSIPARMKNTLNYVNSPVFDRLYNARQGTYINRPISIPREFCL